MVEKSWPERSVTFSWRVSLGSSEVKSAIEDAGAMSG